MTKFWRLLAAVMLLLAPMVAEAQVATIPGVSQSGTVPSGFQAQGFKMDCNNATPTAGQCWPLLEIWDSSGNQATINSSDHGLNTHIVGCAVGICGLPTVTSNALVQGRISTAMTGTTQTQLIAAVTSQHIYVTEVACKNTSATATLVNIEDGSSGTVLAQLAAGATYGGDNLNGGSVPLFWTTAGTALFAVNATTGASVTCNAAGFSSAS